MRKSNWNIFPNDRDEKIETIWVATTYPTTFIIMVPWKMGVSPIFVSFHVGQCSTSMIVGDRVVNDRWPFRRSSTSRSVPGGVETTGFSRLSWDLNHFWGSLMKTLNLKGFRQNGSKVPTILHLFQVYSHTVESHQLWIMWHRNVVHLQDDILISPLTSHVGKHDYSRCLWSSHATIYTKKI